VKTDDCSIKHYRGRGLGFATRARLTAVILVSEDQLDLIAQNGEWQRRIHSQLFTQDMIKLAVFSLDK
jgi:hypothetical protein